VTGWTVTRDRYRPAGGTVQDFTYFNAGTGIYTTPARGVYHCCAYFRGKQGGYYDFTFIRNAGQGDVTYAAFGTRNTGPTQNGWASHGTCITNVCAAGVQWKVNFESGSGSTDCIEETDWRYSRFTCYLASDS